MTQMIKRKNKRQSLKVRHHSMKVESMEDQRFLDMGNLGINKEIVGPLLSSREMGSSQYN